MEAKQVLNYCRIRATTRDPMWMPLNDCDIPATESRVIRTC